jgi:hypothetical protein
MASLCFGYPFDQFIHRPKYPSELHRQTEYQGKSGQDFFKGIWHGELLSSPSGPAEG